MDLFEFANRLAKHSGEFDTLTRPPNGGVEKAVVNSYLGRCALLQVKDCDDGVFKRRTHLVCTLPKYCDKQQNFFAQPFNQSGDKDGVAMVEEAEFLWVFPPLNSKVKLTPGAKDAVVQITNYNVMLGKVEFETAAGKRAAADASPAKTPPPKKKSNRKKTRRQQMR